MKLFQRNTQANPQQGVVYLPPQDQYQYGPAVGQMPQQVPPGYGSTYANGYPGPSPMRPSYGKDTALSNMTGLSPTDVSRLRLEFFNYANSSGVIDREGFRKLYIASLLNMTWEAIERDAEMAFRTFDANNTGGLDFDEYIIACSRMLRGNQQSSMY